MKMNTITYIAFILLAGSGVGAVLLAIGQSISSAKDKGEIVKLTTDKNAELKQQLVDLQKERGQLKDELQDRDKRIHEQQDKILELNTKLLEKSEYISNYVTGGKGYPIVVTNSLKTLSSNENEVTTFTLENETNLPLYNVSAVIFDWNYLKSKMIPTDDKSPPLLKQDDLAKSIIHRFDENEISEHSTLISKEQYDLSDGLLYIKLRCRSSFVFEKIAFVKEGHIIYQGFIVYEENGNVLKEWISPGATESAKTAIKKKYALIPNPARFTLLK